AFELRDSPQEIPVVEEDASGLVLLLRCPPQRLGERSRFASLPIALLSLHGQRQKQSEHDAQEQGKVLQGGSGEHGALLPCGHSRFIFRSLAFFGCAIFFDSPPPFFFVATSRLGAAFARTAGAL